MVPGRVPKALGDLTDTELTALFLHNNESLQVPNNAPLDSDDDMIHSKPRGSGGA